MADTQKDTQPVKGKTTNAVNYVNGVPKWDIAADEVAYALIIEQKGRDYIFAPVLRQHTDAQSKKGFAYANKVALREAIPAMKISGEEFELPLIDEQPYINFVDDHFVSILGTASDDKEQHRKYLDERPSLKVRIFKEGIQGTTIEDEDEDESSNLDLFDISIGIGSEDREVALFHELFSPTKGRKERINMVHRLKDASEKEYQLWRKSSTRKFNPRKKKFITKENYDVLEKIYDDLVVSVDGMIVNGKACRTNNKEDWVSLIPLEHKLLVLNDIFSDYAGKNL